MLHILPSMKLKGIRSDFHNEVVVSFRIYWQKWLKIPLNLSDRVAFTFDFANACSSIVCHCVCMCMCIGVCVSVCVCLLQRWIGINLIGDF